MKRIAVCVSGEGTNLAALMRAERRGALGGSIVLVLADRPCPALARAAAAGIATLMLDPRDQPTRQAWDSAMAEGLLAARADLVVLAGFKRLVGPTTLSRFPGLMVNVHPSLLPSFPGPDAVGGALRAGVRVTGVTIHLVDETLDGGAILAQDAIAIASSDDRASLLARLHAVEHTLLPRVVATRLRDGSPAGPPKRALLSVSDKHGLTDLGQALAESGFELVSTGGTARALREAGLDVTDVAAVTGTAEMLDGRVKTLHPRIAAGVLADLGKPTHRAALADAGIDPFQLVVVNLYPFEDAARRPGVTLPELIEEVDIGGPTLVRAAAKNHAWVAVLTDPADYRPTVNALSADGSVPAVMRRELARKAFAHTARYESIIATSLGRFLGSEEEAQGETLPVVMDMRLERVRTLRYGENPHQRAALYRHAAGPSTLASVTAADDWSAGSEPSYNNLLDVSAAAGICRDLRGPAAVIVKHGNPCGAAEATDLANAWDAALAADPVSAFGGVAALRGKVDVHLAERISRTFLEVLVAEDFDERARQILGLRRGFRLLTDPTLMEAALPALELRSAGGAVLVTAADRLGSPDEPASWQLATTRAPTEAELAGLDLAWRVSRHVSSNAIVLTRDSSVVGVGAGQMSRLDSARLAVAKAADRASGAACASDAFFPFADGVRACLEAGVRAFVQPGGSKRDAEVIAAVEACGGTMLLTGRRHFRH